MNKHPLYNSIILSGTIIRPKNILYVKYEPPKNELQLSELINKDPSFFNENNPPFIKCTCNNHCFFILFQNSDQNDNDLHLYAYEHPNFTKIEVSRIKLPNQDSTFNDRDVSLFCSDNYIFCSILFNMSDSQSRFVTFSLIEHEGSELKFSSHSDYYDYSERAFDFCGNNNNFAYFIFKGYNDNDNKIITYTSSKGWSKSEIQLVNPNDDMNFYNRNYIKMAYDNNDLYLIGANQNSIRNAQTLDKYTTSKESITSIYTIEGLGMVRILNICGKEDCKKIKLNEESFTISLDSETDVSKIFSLFLKYYKEERLSDWIRTKSSCSFHSTAYLRYNKKVQKKMPDKTLIFADVKQFSTASF